MAEAMISGLQNAAVPMNKIRVIELSNDRRKYLREKFGNEIVLLKDYVDDVFRAVVSFIKTKEKKMREEKKKKKKLTPLYEKGRCHSCFEAASGHQRFASSQSEPASFSGCRVDHGRIVHGVSVCFAGRASCSRSMHAQHACSSFQKCFRLDMNLDRKTRLTQVVHLCSLCLQCCCEWRAVEQSSETVGQHGRMLDSCGG